MQHQSREVLQKIYRDFTENEAINVLRAELKAVQFELGVQKSDNDELKAALAKKKKNKDWDKDENVIAIKNHLKRSQAKNAPLKKEVEYWRNKYFSEMARNTSSHIQQ
jgi:hypothetical protein